MKTFKVIFVITVGTIINNLETECKGNTKLEAYEAAKKEMIEKIETTKSSAKFAIVLIEEMEEK